MNNDSQKLGHTTLNGKSGPTMVTITHPHHPFFGQQFEFVKLRKSTPPRVVVRLPAGNSAYLPVEYTDYRSTGTPDVNKNDESSEETLLDVDGLLRAVNLVNDLKKRRRVRKSVSIKHKG